MRLVVNVNVNAIHLYCTLLYRYAILWTYVRLNDGVIGQNLVNISPIKQKEMPQDFPTQFSIGNSAVHVADDQYETYCTYIFYEYIVYSSNEYSFISEAQPLNKTSDNTSIK